MKQKIIGFVAATVVGLSTTAAVTAGPIDDLRKGAKEVVTDINKAMGGSSVAETNYVKVADAIPGRFIVLLNDGQPLKQTIQGLMATLGIKPDLLFSNAVNGFAAPLSDTQARQLAADKRVALVEQDAWVKPFGTRNNVVWGLDRIDQKDLPLNRKLSSELDGAGVHVYVIDTGVRGDHEEFSGRMGDGANYAGEQPSNGGGGGGGFPLLGGGFPLLGGLFGGNDDEPAPPSETNDCNGHGTHVAGTIAGSEYGVAPKATVHAIRVLDCNGSGSMSGVIKGVDWVTKNHQRPAVANMSLGGGASSALDKAVANSIKAGVHYVVAAGNEDQNACDVSPARTDAALTVGATDKRDQRASFSNWGSCVDIFAPGVDIKSAWHTGSTKTNTISGTSMAAPHVAGAAALWLQKDADIGTSALFKKIIQEGVGDRVNDSKRSPNTLLQITKGQAPTPPKEDGEEGGESGAKKPTSPGGNDEVEQSQSKTWLQKIEDFFKDL